MTIERYYVAKEDYLIESDIEAERAVNFVLALVDAKLDTTRAAGPELAEKEEVLDALEATRDQLEELLGDVQEIMDGGARDAG